MILPAMEALFIQLLKMESMLPCSRCPRVSPRRKQRKGLVGSQARFMDQLLCLWDFQAVREGAIQDTVLVPAPSQGQRSQLKHLRKKAENKGRQQKPELKLHLLPGLSGSSNPASACYSVEPRGSAQGHASGDLSFSKQPLPVLSDEKGK